MTRVRWAGLMVGVGLAYFATGRLGLALDAVSDVAALVWLPTGIALAALTVLGLRAWPGVLLGALMVALTTRPSSPIAPVTGTLVGLGIAFGNAVGPVMTAWVLRRAGFRATLGRVTDVLLLVVLGADLFTVISPSIGVSTLWAAGLLPTSAVPGTWVSWWLGDGLGVLLAAPLLMAWSTSTGRLARGEPRVTEAAALALSVVAVSTLIHFAFSDGSPEFLALKPYLAFPLLVWAALRFGMRGTVTTMFAIATLGILGSALSLSSATSGSLTRELTLVQIFDGIAAATAMVLAAAMTQRQQAQAAVRVLSDASLALSESLDYQASVGKAAQLALPMLGELCVIDVFEDATPRRVAAVHLDPAKGALMTELRTRFLPQLGSPQLGAGAFKTRAAVVVPSLGEGWLATHTTSAEHADLIRRIGVQSLLIVPLLVRDRSLGVITFGASLESRYGDAEVALAAELATRVSLAIDNAQLYAQAQSVIRVRDENETLGTLIRILSHDLANTVQVVMFEASELKGTRDVEGASARLIEVATAQAQMIRHAREAYQARHQASSQQLQSVDLADAVAGALTVFDAGIRSKGLVVNNHVPRGTHFAQAQLQTLTHQVLANLLSNAIKFTPRGRGIELRVEALGAELALVIADEGIGMNETTLGAGEHSTPSTPGTEGERGSGLGLLQVQHFVASFGGRLEMVSRPGREGAPGGTTFRVVLKKAPHSSA